LGIEIATGEIYPFKSLHRLISKVTAAVDVRSARAFSEEATQTHALFDTAKEGQVRVNPFQYKAAEELNVLLTVR
jgi:hypothetical protein